MADVFDVDSILAIETAASKKGEEAGIVEGNAAAQTDGRNLGIMKAWEVGIEIGFYSGACKYLLENLPASMELEKQNKLQTMCESVISMCGEFPRINDSGGVQGNSSNSGGRGGGNESNHDDNNNDSGSGREAGEATHKLQLVRSKFKVICRRVKLKSPLGLKEIFGEGSGARQAPEGTPDGLANLAAVNENAEGELF
ncbi:hypothetical protein TrLO_g52 [Triparma laevis f. longispina]|uniref:Essential protein Yae1 N-terminal domain-containing protein n=1 Tax=Triparma laevis f. longispina TaxID=1714387 RepID=A0A9W7CB47_9STRA|nr:hypothetical protein TrLO_g52 [Triparma laevis f. longispina]